MKKKRHKKTFLFSDKLAKFMKYACYVCDIDEEEVLRRALALFEAALENEKVFVQDSDGNLKEVKIK